MTGDAVLVGLDLGTTVCRSIVFDQKMQILASASRHLPISTLSGTEIEQSAELWWETSAAVIRESLQGLDIRPGRVCGISVSSQGLSFVPVNDSCEPMRSAFSWMDTRAVMQRRHIAEKIGEERIFAITGKRCHETYVLPKLLWLKENQRQLYDSCAKILMPLDFVIARLTGEYVTDHTMASGTMFYDVVRGQWSQEILSAFDVDARKLPELRYSGTAVGGLRAVASEALQLPRGVVVSVGGQDQKVAALGAGIDLRRTTISLGTAMAITQKSRQPVIDRLRRVPCFADLLRDHWVLEGSAVCCSILEWVRQSFLPDKSYDDLNRLVAEAGAWKEAPFLLPFFSGALSPFYDSSAQGTLHGLNLSTSPGQIVRGVYEGIAFLVRANVEVMSKISRPVEELRIFGGGSRSDQWCQIIADVTERTVSTLQTSECASTGAAILAGLGGGVFQGLEQPFAYIRTRRSFEPDQSRFELCRERYAEFQDLRGRLGGNAECQEGLGWAD